MVARAAQWNPSVFRREGPLPLETVIADYLRYVRLGAASAARSFVALSSS